MDANSNFAAAKQKFVVRAQTAFSLLLTLALASVMVGCGNLFYSIEANSASSKLAEARELGAEEYAPYEYYMAKEHLEKARSEAAEADYQDAAELSGLSAEYADKAIILSRDAHRGAGR